METMKNIIIYKIYIILTLTHERKPKKMSQLLKPLNQYPLFNSLLPWDELFN